MGKKKHVLKFNNIDEYGDTSLEDVSNKWGVYGGGAIRPAPLTIEKLIPGVYAGGCNDAGFFIVPAPQVSDELTVLPGSVNEEILAEIATFWKLRPEFVKRGLTYKRGVLLYGPAGSGKTVAVRQLMSDVVNNMDGIVFLLQNIGVAHGCLSMIRLLEPALPIVVVIEDIDIYIQGGTVESELLSLLDGEKQIDNVVYVATTNYVKDLPARLVNRPSRFDAVKYVGMPNAEAREAYLLHKEPSLKKHDEIDLWVKHSEGLSIAHLRELIILCRCYGIPFESAIGRLEAMKVLQTDEAEEAKANDGKVVGITAAATPQPQRLTGRK